MIAFLMTTFAVLRHHVVSGQTAALAVTTACARGDRDRRPQKWLGGLDIKYPRTVAFGVALSIPVMVKAAQSVAERKKAPAAPLGPAPVKGMDGTARDTAILASPASSGSPASPDAGKATEWAGSFKVAGG